MNTTIDQDKAAKEYADGSGEYLPTDGVAKFVEHLIELGAIKQGFDITREFLEFNFDADYIVAS